MSRAARKLDHINHALLTGQERTHGFQDVKFIHNSIPETNVDSISLTSQIGELTLSSPIFINAMTGGGGIQTEKINRELAEVAQETGVGMAVGSQMAALKESEQLSSYQVVRKAHPNGIIFANLGSEATVDQAKKAVDMIEANALQIHVNVIQELVMPEGDRDFTGTCNRIEAIVKELEVPVVVKEVGYGMSARTVEILGSLGVSIVDIGGFGGTNFSKIENERRHRRLDFFDDWGITTTCSILEASEANADVDIIASGGMQSALDLAKAIAMGASAGGFAGYFLKQMIDHGQEGLIEEIKAIQTDLRYIMTALQSNTVLALREVPLVISGETYHWASQRGFDVSKLSQRF
ncbi:type 2 isopentenyl-diphosphate Delta-isomerase [Halalkalibacter nanhaiisediminis]|uniref:type 2 isopentenyl-diphosphate Delta-isomerase n=1 Tax=Halalkalibacter nanhaiisediminis TaxID=688079 RepID=UPI0011A03F19|nr:type 2 isopentenyl-diphosphate Delta-isomerase [Halalkalibacter nanhaiisediminis]